MMIVIIHLIYLFKFYLFKFIVKFYFMYKKFTVEARFVIFGEHSKNKFGYFDIDN